VSLTQTGQRARPARRARFLGNSRHGNNGLIAARPPDGTTTPLGRPGAPARGSARRPRAGNLGRVRVLVVEDERRLAAAVRRGLVAEGFAVDLAHNGEDGLHAAREGGYDAVVLDLMLPKISGYKICQQLRSEENWVPILILSAKDGEYDQADGLDLGADDYLTKPFSYVVLAARLRALLRRGAVPRPAQLRAGDLVLDPASRRVRRGETDIDLTAREFALLEYLMRRPGQVVAKTELLEHVWDSYDSLDLNVVEVYAGYVRRKIDAPFGRGALQTVRGAGYRLAADGG
jgi:DNA-binding response OmpR family regulator